MQVQILPAVFLCSATSAVVLLSITTLFAIAPFIPDGQEEAIKKVALDFSIPLLGSAIWLLMAMVLCTLLENWEIEERLNAMEQRHLELLRQRDAEARDILGWVEQQRSSEPSNTAPHVTATVTDTPCTTCKYWAADKVGKYFDHACAVHPLARPGKRCSDWDGGTDEQMS